MAERRPNTPTELRHKSLLDLVPQGFEQSIVVHVLNHRAELPKDVRRELNSAINSVVRVPQFPKQPAIAPAPLLKQLVIDQLVSSEPLANAVLRAWFVSQETLYAIVKGYLYSRDMDIEYPDLVGHRFRGTWSHDDWMSEREGILAVHGDLNEDDVALMLCFAADKIPSDGKVESRGEADPMNQNVLLQAVRFLEFLPADALEWFSDVPDFQSSVNDIVDRKRDERESVAAVQELNTLIAELRQYSNLFEYLELDLSSWEAPASLSPGEVAKVRERLTKFSDFLEEYDPAPKMGSSFSETQRLRDEHDAATRSLLDLKSELDEALTAGTAVRQDPVESTPDHSVHIAGQEPDRTGSLSDIRLSDGALDFSPTQKNYTINLDNDVESLAITPVTDHVDVRVDLAVLTPGGEWIKGLESDHGTFIVSSLNVGQTVISISIVAEDHIYSETYMLAVTRAPNTLVTPTRSSDARLEGLHLLGTHLEFPPGVAQINIDLPEEIGSLTVVPETAHVAATVVLAAVLSDGTTVDGLMSDAGGFAIAGDALGSGDLALHVNVTAEDNETTQTYKVFAKRQPVLDVPSILWALVAQDDLAGAYWVARSMTVQGVKPPAPPQVLKALQGGRWLSPDTDIFVGDLFDIVGELEALDDNDAQTLLRLSAGLLPSLIAPETNLLAWLSTPRCLPELESIVSPIKVFAAAGNPLRPELITGDEGLQHLQGLIMEASAEAQKWLQEAPQYQTSFSRAVKVWQYLCGEGVLNQMLTPVSQDRRNQINTVQGYIDVLNRDGCAEVINQAENLMVGRPSRQGDIVGNARDWLVKRIEEAKDRAIVWCSRVSREASTRPGRLDKRLQEQVSSLRYQLQAKCQTVLEALLELGSEGNPQDLAASARCATRALQQLADYMNIDIQHEPLEESPPIVRYLEAINLSEGSVLNHSNVVSQLETAISRRLLWVPSVEIDDACVPVSDDSLVDMVRDTASLHQGDTSLENALQKRMDHRDFRFSDILMSGLPRESLDHNRNRYLAALTVEKKTLREAIDLTEAAVDQAEKDGVIEFEGSQWNKHQYTLSDLDVEAVLNFRPVYDALEAIKKELHEERMQRGQELLEEWQALTGESAGDLDLNGDLLKEVSSTFEKARNTDSLDIRVMEECVSRLRNHHSGEEVSVAQTTREGIQPRPLEEFLRFYEAIANPRVHVQDSNGLNNLALELKAGV